MRELLWNGPPSLNGVKVNGLLLLPEDTVLVRKREWKEYMRRGIIQSA
jgi:hypothetical protein